MLKKIGIQSVALAIAVSLTVAIWGCGSGQPAKPASQTAPPVASQAKAAKSPMPASLKQPHTVKAAGTVEVAFSPNGGGAAMIVKAIGEAKKSVKVQAYSFTNADIAKALVEAKKRGVDVRIVLDKSQETEKYSSATFFVNSGLPVRIDDDFAIAHSKVMIIDEETVITGSFNFTKAAEEKNGENVLVMRGNKELAALYLQNWQWRWDASETYKKPAGQ